jgi:calcineurin-like phosphoesterase family protein
MDNYIIDKINKTVSEQDTLYHLGDFCFCYRKIEVFLEYLDKIKCKNIVLVKGNHDEVSHYDYLREYRPDIKLVENYCLVRHENYVFHLSHYRMTKDIPLKDNEKLFYLYGHEHGKNNFEQDKMDVGIDSIKDWPISVDNVILMTTMNESERTERMYLLGNGK